MSIKTSKLSASDKIIKAKLWKDGAYKCVDAFAIVGDIEFAACVREYDFSTEYYFKINGKRLRGKSNQDNITENMMKWANNEVESFINHFKKRKD